MTLLVMDDNYLKLNLHHHPPHSLTVERVESHDSSYEFMLQITWGGLDHGTV